MPSRAPRRGSARADLGTLTIGIPLAQVNEHRPGPRVVITAGVHGGEVHAPATGSVFYGMHGRTVVPGTDLAAIAARRRNTR